MNKFIKLALVLGIVGSLCSCSTKPQEVSVEKVVETTTPSVEVFTGSMEKEIDDLSLIKNNKVYEDLGVTGKKLGDLDIYLNKKEQKYVVICGDSLVYLPIDKDGVVKLKDGFRRYWQESRRTINYVLIGKNAKKYEQAVEKGTDGYALYLNGKYCPDGKVWREDENAKFSVDLETLCNILEMQYDFSNGNVEISGLDGELNITIDKNCDVWYKGKLIECEDVENLEENGCVVGTDFLTKVLGLKCDEESMVLDISGLLVPNIILLDNYTATDALKLPFSKPKRGISIYNMFGEFDQTSDIQSGKVEHQLYVR